MNLKSGYPVKQFDQPVKRYCQTLELKYDPALIEEYKYWHRPENRWPEIPQGIREVGILDMEIYLLGSLLFMIVETPLDFEWDSAFAKLAVLNRQAEWEEFMAKFQLTKPGASSAEKWVLMERIFSL
ncbi:L-rhamnose mutarotase [Parabacteroides sp. FAFU027]|uniref:L-rhamnose mutarotase n=1 Tax=Parabacteroides sp. FAFU027 TaxID=2922715 RepID=UPI001FAF6AF0|nr:L-rhamnose mutarotase [Parabacteroides sp. FAFU027]